MLLAHPQPTFTEHVPRPIKYSRHCHPDKPLAKWSASYALAAYLQLDGTIAFDSPSISSPIRCPPNRSGDHFPHCRLEPASGAWSPRVRYIGYTLLKLRAARVTTDSNVGHRGDAAGRSPYAAGCQRLLGVSARGVGCVRAAICLAT
jgi:hypothetical protein